MFAVIGSMRKLSKESFVWLTNIVAFLVVYTVSKLFKFSYHVFGSLRTALGWILCVRNMMLGFKTQTTLTPPFSLSINLKPGLYFWWHHTWQRWPWKFNIVVLWHCYAPSYVLHINIDSINGSAGLCWLLMSHDGLCHHVALSKV